jgi:hypothetical protein
MLRRFFPPALRKIKRRRPRKAEIARMEERAAAAGLNVNGEDRRHPAYGVAPRHAARLIELVCR